MEIEIILVTNSLNYWQHCIKFMLIDKHVIECYFVLNIFKNFIFISAITK